MHRQRANKTLSYKKIADCKYIETVMFAFCEMFRTKWQQ